jgi:AraC family transcriptional regulator
MENSKICKELFPINQYIVPMSIEQFKNRFPVEIREFPERQVSFIRVVGAYEEGLVLKAFDRMIKWAKQMDLYDTETIFGMSVDDPMVTQQDKYRYEVCLTIPKSLTENHEFDLSTMTIPKFFI